ncbi:hypothetical protein CaCOL14_000812 [Colletotrichum acutatum]
MKRRETPAQFPACRVGVRISQFHPEVVMRFADLRMELVRIATRTRILRATALHRQFISRLPR